MTCSELIISTTHVFLSFGGAYLLAYDTCVITGESMIERLPYIAHLSVATCDVFQEWASRFRHGTTCSILRSEQGQYERALLYWGVGQRVGVTCGEVEGFFFEAWTPNALTGLSWYPVLGLRRLDLFRRGYSTVTLFGQNSRSTVLYIRRTSGSLGDKSNMKRNQNMKALHLRCITRGSKVCPLKYTIYVHVCGGAVSDGVRHRRVKLDAAS